MSYLMTLSWTQIFLIETGALFLIVAFSAHLRKAYAYRLAHEGDIKEESDQSETPEEQAHRKAERAAQLLAWKPIEQSERSEPSTMASAGQIFKTAKIGFVQNFKYRQGAS
jgi:hypothetical protein